LVCSCGGYLENRELHLGDDVKVPNGEADLISGYVFYIYDATQKALVYTDNEMIPSMIVPLRALHLVV
jgi:hypothetical protein